MGTRARHNEMLKLSRAGPSFFEFNIGNMLETDIEMTTDFNKGFSFLKHFSDIFNFFFCNLSHWIFLSPLITLVSFSARHITAFFHHILSIVFVCTSKEVPPVCTGAIVAFMAGKFSFWDRTYEELIGYLVPFPFSLPVVYSGVPLSKQFSLPSPAGVRIFRNNGPFHESFSKTFRTSSASLLVIAFPRTEFAQVTLNSIRKNYEWSGAVLAGALDSGCPSFMSTLPGAIFPPSPGCYPGGFLKLVPTNQAGENGLM